MKDLLCKIRLGDEMVDGSSLPADLFKDGQLTLKGIEEADRVRLASVLRVQEGWYASSDGELFTVGPYGDKQDAINEAVSDELGWNEGACHFTIAYAKEQVARVSSRFDADRFIEDAEDHYCEYGDPDGNQAMIEPTREQIADLETRVRKAIDDWQVVNGLRFKLWAFAECSQYEEITVPTFDVRKETNDLDPSIEMEVAYNHQDKYIGMVEDAEQLCNVRGIIPEVIDDTHNVCSIGYCPKEDKWYGWSHRAIFGFGVGSEVKRGDCAYTPTDMEDARLDAIRFWSDDDHLDVKAVATTDDDGKPCFDVSWTVPNEKARGQISGCRHYPPEEFGNGEWVAQTLDDAKQMAIDFARGVA